MELKIDKLKAGYGEKNVVDEITFTACSGRVTGIAGPNGVGKSTLLKCVAGLMRPAGGCISLDGSDMGKMNSRERARVLAYVPQKPALTFPMQAEDFIMLGRRPYVEWSLREKDYAVAEEVIRYLDIAHLREKYVDEISGGEYQKVMLARALVQEPKVLLLDEPTSALDIRHQIEVMQILRRVSREKNCIVLLVMHDLSLILRFTDQTAFLSGGHLEAFGDTEEIMTEELTEKVFGIPVKILNTPYGITMISQEEQICTME